MFWILFHTPIYLFLGALVSTTLLCVFFWGGKKYNFAFLEDIRKIYKRNSGTYIFTLFLIASINFLFFVFLAHPYLIETSEKIQREALDIEIVFDLSNSMLAEDMSPSRLSVAKEVLRGFLTQIQDVRIGLVLFAGKPFTSTPLTFDTRFLQEFVSGIEIDTIDQSNFDMAGTAIGDALLLAQVNLLKEKTADTKEQIIILLTDGEANKWIAPLLVLKKLKEENIKTYTIGVGKDKNTFITLSDNLTWFPQQIPVGGVDEETLKKISSETGAKYYKADSKKSLEEIFTDIAKLEKTEYSYEIHERQLSLRFSVLLMLLLCSLSLFFLHFFKPIRF